MAFTMTGLSITYANAATPSTILGAIAYAGYPSASLVLMGGTGGNSLTISSTPSLMNTAIYTGTGSSNTVLVAGSSSSTTLSLDLQGTSDTLNLGDGDLIGLNSSFSFSFSNPAYVFVDDHLNTGTYSYAISDGSGSISLTISLSGSSRTFSLSDSIFLSLEFDNGGTVGQPGNSITINGTPSNVTTTVNAGPGNNTVNVQGTGSDSTLDVVGGGGTDTVTLGGATGVGLLSLRGTVNVSNPSGSTALTIDDSEDSSSGLSLTIGSSQATASLSSVISATFNYSNLSSLTFQGSSYGSNTIGLNSTPAGTSVSPITTTLIGDGPDDFITVVSVNQYGPLVVDAASQADRIDIGDGQLTSISALVTLQSLASTSATIDDTSDSTSLAFTITGTSLKFADASSPSTILGSVKYSSSPTIGSLVIDASDQGFNTVTVTGMPSLSGALFLNMGTGSNNMVTLGGATASTAAYTLSDIDVDPSSANTQVTVNDKADPTPSQSFNLSGSGISTTLTFGVSSSASFEFSGLGSSTLAGPALLIEGGNLGNIFNISDTIANHHTKIKTGSGTNTVNVTGTASSTNSVLEIVGGGTDSVTLGGKSGVGLLALRGTVNISNPSGSTALTIDDSEDTSDGLSLTIGSSQATASFSSVISTTFSYSNLNSFTIEASSYGSNTIIVDDTPTGTSSTPVTTTLLGDGPSDSVTVAGVSEYGPLVFDANGNTDSIDIGDSNLSNISDKITLQSIAGTSLLFDDTSDSTSLAFTLTGTSLSFADAATPSTNLSTIDYSGGPPSGLTIDGNDGGDNSFTVNSTPAGTSVSPITTTIDANGTSDSISISGVTTYGPLVVDANGNADSIDIGEGSLSSISAPITLQSLTSTSVTVDDTSDSTAVAFTLTGTSLTFADAASPSTILATVDYSGAPSAALTIEGGSGGNSFTISNTPPGMTTTVDTGTGSANTVLVGGIAAGLTLDLNLQGTGDTLNLGDGDMAGLQGTLTPTTSNPIHLIVDDHLDSASQTYAISDTGGVLSTSISGLPGTYSFADSAFLSVEYDAGGTAGIAGNSFTIAGTPDDITTTIDAGPGNNTVDAQETGNSGSTLDIVGGGGTDTVTLGGAAGLGALYVSGTVDVSNPGGSTSLTIDDSEDSAYGLSLTVGSGQATASLGTHAPATFDYSDLSSLTFQGSSYGSNTITVDDTPAGTSSTPVTTTLIGDGPGDSVTVSGVSQYGPLIVDAEGNSDSIDIGGGDLANLSAQVTLQGLSGSSLTVDDTSGSTSLAFTVTGTSLTYADASSPSTILGTVDYAANPSLAAMAIDASDQGSNSIRVTGMPALSNALALDMGTGTGNAVTLGGSTSATAASSLGDINVDPPSGYTQVTVVDSADPDAGQSFSLSGSGGSTALTFGVSSSASFTFSGLGSPNSSTPALLIEAGSLGNVFNISDTVADQLTQIDTGLGDNSVDVTSTASPSDSTLDIVGGGGTDTVTLGGAAGLGALYVSGTVDVSNPGGSTALTIDDSEDSAYGLSLTVGSGQAIASLGTHAPATFDYSDLSSLTFQGSSYGSNSITVNGTPAGTSSTPVTTTLIGDGPGDSASIFGVSQYGPLVVNPNGNPDSIDIGEGDLSSISALISLESLTSTSVTVDDSSDATAMAFTVTGTSLTFADAASPSIILGTIDYSGAPSASLTIEGGSAGNSFTISGTPSSMTTTVDPGTGSGNTVLVGGITAGSTLDLNLQGTDDTLNLGDGDLSDLQGTLTPTSSDPVHLIVDDHLDSATKTYTISDTSGVLSTSISGLPGTYSFADSSFLSVEYDAGGTAGIAGNSFTIAGTPDDITTTIDAGPGNNTVDAQETGNSGSTLDIVGGGGTDTVTLGGAAGLGALYVSGTVDVSNPGGSTSLTIDDSEDSAYGLSLTVGSGQATASLGTHAPATFDYSDLSSLTFQGSSYGSNTITVDDTPAGTSSTPVTTTLIGDGPGDSVTVSGVSQYGPLIVDADGNTDSIDIGGGDLDNISDNITLQSIAGTSVMVDDTSGPTSLAFSLTGTSLTFADAASPSTILATIDFSAGPPSGLTIDGSTDGGNTVSVDSTPAGTSSMPVTTTFVGNGPGDSITISGVTTYGPLVVDANDNTDSIDIGGGDLANISGQVTLQGLAGSSLAVNDSSDSTAIAFTLTGTSLTFADAASSSIILGTVDYSGAPSSLTIEGGTGGNSFTISSTPPGMTTTVDPGTGSGNTVLVGGIAAGSTLDLNLQGTGDSLNLGDGDLAALQGTLTPTTSDPVHLIVDDHLDSASQTYAISDTGGVLSTSISGLPGTYSFADSAFLSVDYDAGGTAAVTGNSFTIAGTPDDITTTIDAGPGNNTVERAGDGQLRLDARHRRRWRDGHGHAGRGHRIGRPLCQRDGRCLQPRRLDLAHDRRLGGFGIRSVAHRRIRPGDRLARHARTRDVQLQRPQQLDLPGQLLRQQHDHRRWHSSRHLVHARHHHTRRRWAGRLGHRRGRQPIWASGRRRRRQHRFDRHRRRRPLEHLRQHHAPEHRQHLPVDRRHQRIDLTGLHADRDLARLRRCRIALDHPVHHRLFRRSARQPDDPGQHRRREFARRR